MGTLFMQSSGGMDLAGLAALFLQPSAPGFWLLVDLLLSIALLVLMPVAKWQRPGLAQGMYWLIVPFLAMLPGAVSPQALGMTGVDWTAALKSGLPLSVALVLLLATVRLTADATHADRLSGMAHATEGRNGSGTVAFALLSAGAQQLHWCFQRSALMAVFAVTFPVSGSSTYWATWASMLFAVPALLLLESGWARLWNVVALVATAILFLHAGNFWLCWAVHACALLLAGPSLFRLPTSAPGEGRL